MMNLDRVDKIENERAAIVKDHKKLIIFRDKICEFAGDHWQRHEDNRGQGRWNGRQIRNAVQIAASLAFYENKTDKTCIENNLQPTLDVKHFQTVEKTMALFDGYMTKARGGNDAYMAEQRAERYDSFRMPEVDLRQPYQGTTATSQISGGYQQNPYGQRMSQAIPPQQHQQQQHQFGQPLMQGQGLSGQQYGQGINMQQNPFGNPMYQPNLAAGGSFDSGASQQPIGNIPFGIPPPPPPPPQM